MYLVGAVGELVLKYFYRHLALYLALFLLFSIGGVGFGALAPQKLSPPQRADLSGFCPISILRLLKTTRR